VADTPIGSKVNLTVLRDGHKVPAVVTLTERNKDQLAGNEEGTPDKGTPDSPVNLGGLKVRDLSRTEHASAKIANGVAITDVEDGSAADEAGLQPGDIIEEVGGKAVNSADEFEKSVADARKVDKKHAVLLVRRGEGSQFVALRIKD